VVLGSVVAISGASPPESDVAKILSGERRNLARPKVLGAFRFAARAGVHRAGFRSERSAESFTVPRHETIRRARQDGNRRSHSSERLALRKEAKEGSDRIARRTHGAVGKHQMPGRHLRLLVHPRKECVRLRAVEGHRTDPAVAVPGEDLVQRPTAEAAVGVVEQDVVGCHRTFSLERYDNLYCGRVHAIRAVERKNAYWGFEAVGIWNVTHPRAHPPGASTVLCRAGSLTTWSTG
jgi:hypothetical protein